MASWVKIRRYLTREGALVERSLLESAGLTVWSPDEIVYGTLTHIEDAALEGYRLFVIDADVDAARTLLSYRDDEETSYPCAQCGRKTRRLKSLSATIALSLFFFFNGGPVPAPLRRRRRICNGDRTRFTPERAAPFTQEELGYPPPSNLVAQLRSLLAWGRSIGYQPDDNDDRSPP